MNDLVLKNGRVVDPSQALDKVTDIAFSGGKVSAIGDGLSGPDERDVRGKIVAPGLIDLHTHVYWGGTSLGVEAELVARTGGVTTFIDAGSAGPGNFHGFRKHVIEPSAGADRATLAFLCEAYKEDQQPDDQGKPEPRISLSLHPRLAPMKAAVFPLVKKNGMPEIARELYAELKRNYNVFYDEKDSVGRRYRRQDEIGTPFCFTIDGQTLEDKTVTIRERDSLEQRRIRIEECLGELRKKL